MRITGNYGFFYVVVKDKKELSFVTQLSVGWNEGSCSFAQLDFRWEEEAGFA